jgi:hypothetical protein
VNVHIPERARAWAWHFVYWAAGAAVLLVLIWGAVWTIHLAGAAVGLIALMVVVLGGLATASWWASGKGRP